MVGGVALTMLSGSRFVLVVGLLGTEVGKMGKGMGSLRTVFMAWLLEVGGGDEVREVLGLWRSFSIDENCICVSAVWVWMRRGLSPPLKFGNGWAPWLKHNYFKTILMFLLSGPSHCLFKLSPVLEWIFNRQLIKSLAVLNTTLHWQC